MYIILNVYILKIEIKQKDMGEFKSKKPFLSEQESDKLMENPEWLNEVFGEATAKAAQQAMDTVGYIVVAEDGWVVKKYKEGGVEKISKIE